MQIYNNVIVDICLVESNIQDAQALSSETYSIYPFSLNLIYPFLLNQIKPEVKCASYAWWIR